MRISMLVRFLLAGLAMHIVDGVDGAASAPTDATDAAPSSSAPTPEPAPEGNGDAQVAADESLADGQKASSDAASASSTEAGSGEAPNAGASDAASPSASDTSSSAQAALPAVDTALSGISQGDAAADPTPAVHIDVEDHAEAKERFAGIMARLHRFESEAVAELKEDMKAIATLLHLHSVASGHAEATGDYKSSDL